MTETTAAFHRNAFADAEASLKLEGLDPTKDPLYLSVRERIINGTLSLEQARAIFIADSAKKLNAAE